MTDEPDRIRIQVNHDQYFTQDKSVVRVEWVIPTSDVDQFLTRLEEWDVTQGGTND